MKSGHIVMYGFLAIIAVVLLKNAAGSIGLFLAGDKFGTDIIGALEGSGTANTSKGSFSFGGTKISLG